MACALIALVGCDGDEAGPALAGVWSLERGDGCLAGLRFDADGDFASGIACKLETGQVGLERYEGTYWTSEGELYLHFERGTCDVPPATESYRFELRGARLILDGPDGRAVFKMASDDGEGSGVIRYGCWEGDTLVFGELQTL